MAQSSEHKDLHQGQYKRRCHLKWRPGSRRDLSKQDETHFRRGRQGFAQYDQIGS